mgnify:CR=1 FL=1
MSEAPGEHLADARRALATPRQLTVCTLWDGTAADKSESVTMRLELRREELVVEVEAPYHGDPAPPGLPGPGPTDALWEHEVVELMLLGDDERYLEVELSPHGHYLALQLQGPRRTVHSGLHLGVRSAIQGHRWRGRAEIPGCWLPSGLSRLNAFAMHGVGPARRYLCWRAASTPGPRPDFHRLEAFGQLSAL